MYLGQRYLDMRKGDTPLKHKENVKVGVQKQNPERPVSSGGSFHTAEISSIKSRFRTISDSSGSLKLGDSAGQLNKPSTFKKYGWKMVNGVLSYGLLSGVMVSANLISDKLTKENSTANITNIFQHQFDLILPTETLATAQVSEQVDALVGDPNGQPTTHAISTIPVTTSTKSYSLSSNQRLVKIKSVKLLEQPSIIPPFSTTPHPTKDFEWLPWLILLAVVCTLCGILATWASILFCKKLQTICGRKKTIPEEEEEDGCKLHVTFDFETENPKLTLFHVFVGCLWELDSSSFVIVISIHESLLIEYFYSNDSRLTLLGCNIISSLSHS